MSKKTVNLQLIDKVEGIFGIIIALSAHVKTVKTLPNKDFYYY